MSLSAEAGGLYVPDVGPDADPLSAAFAYAEAGWYVLPVHPRTKHAGSVVGKGWPGKSSRDPQQLADWFLTDGHGALALHVGRSGAVVFDVDDSDRLPEVLAEAISAEGVPYQSTRAEVPMRGHYVFAQPHGRSLGNGSGGLGGGWGEVRGRNGIIVVAPSIHAKTEEGARYAWQSTGAVPALPDALAELLNDAASTEDAATDAEVQRFLDTYTTGMRPYLLKGITGQFGARTAKGASRHDTMVGKCSDAMKEARAGLYPARAAADALEELFIASLAAPRPGSTRVKDAGGAREEFAGIRSWAVGQAKALTEAELNRIRAGAAERVPSQTPEEGDAASPLAPVRDRAHGDAEAEETARSLLLTPASAITPEPVIWAWEPAEEGDGGRIPAGALTLAAGREGTGKSSFGIWLAARLSRGTLPGAFHGRPRAVLYAAVEDSWSRTLVPRLMAAGADLDRVYRVEVRTLTGEEAMISLPVDVELIEGGIAEHDVAALIVDPLMSTLTGRTDAHRTQDVRQALEPLVRMAERTRALTLGICHFNKAQGSDASLLISGSGAFKDLSRAVLAFARDRDTEAQVMSQTKNSLGRLDLPSLAYDIKGTDVETPKGTANVGRLEFTGIAERSVEDTLSAPSDPSDTGERREIDDWLRHLLGNGRVESNEVYRAADAAGLSKDQAKRAKKRLGVLAVHPDVTGPWFWELPQGGTQGSQGSGDTGARSLAPLDAPLDACAVCGEPMTAYDPKETTHPNCDPKEHAA